MELTVIICCRVHLFAEGIRRLLEENEQIRALGIACTDAEIKDLMQNEPDVIIADVGSCRKVLSLLPSAADKKVLLINDAGDLSSDRLRAMIADGLGGLLPRTADSEQLEKATRKLYDGELWIDRHTTREVLSRAPETSPDIRLTNKEIEILNCICAGMTNKEIARKLYISEQTVKSHCNHLFKKFGVKNRLKLALEAPRICAEGFACGDLSLSPPS